MNDKFDDNDKNFQVLKNWEGRKGLFFWFFFVPQYSKSQDLKIADKLAFNQLYQYLERHFEAFSQTTEYPVLMPIIKKKNI